MRKKKLTDMYLDDKYSELSKKLDKCEEEKVIFSDCELSQKNIVDKMKAIRAKLKNAEDGTVAPYKLTFVLKGMDERSIPDARDRYMNLHKAV